jgi:hypothetical protein
MLRLNNQVYSILFSAASKRRPPCVYTELKVVQRKQCMYSRTYELLLMLRTLTDIQFQLLS